MALSKLCSMHFWDSCRDVPCDISQGLCHFINSGVGNMVQAPFIGVELEDATVQLQVTIENDCGRDGESNSVVDKCDGEKFSKTEKAVKINEVSLGSFAHGFGLRENDIILTVNDIRVESAQMTNFLVNKSIGINKNSRLAMEIQRIERGLIRLDNQGDEIEVEAIEDVICISCLADHQQKVYRLKNLRYRKYLTVRNGNVHLSRHTTHKRETYFVVYQYEKNFGDSAVNRFIMLKHKASGKCLYLENNKLILKYPPKLVTRLSGDSAFLFKMKTSSNTDYTESPPIFFETITSPDMAIGFQNRRRKAVLLSESNAKVLFNVFEV